MLVSLFINPCKEFKEKYFNTTCRVYCVINLLIEILKDDFSTFLNCQLQLHYEPKLQCFQSIFLLLRTFELQPVEPGVVPPALVALHLGPEPGDGSSLRTARGGPVAFKIITVFRVTFWQPRVSGFNPPTPLDSPVAFNAVTFAIFKITTMFK